MGKELLVNYIDDGKKLIELLDKNKQFTVTAALWYYISDSSEWRLLVASPYVQRNGAKKSYKLIQSILRESLPKSYLSLSQISVIKPNDSFLNMLRSVIKCEGISAARFSNFTVNNFTIEDALIYRVT